MRWPRRLSFLAFCWVACAASVWGAPGARGPQVAYIYPAGGQQGTTVGITAGGQFLNNPGKVYVSGEGVQATVAYFVRPLSPDQLRELGRRLTELRKQRFPGMLGMPGMEGKGSKPTEGVTLPDLPILQDLEKKSPEQIRRIGREFMAASIQQRTNPQMAEIVHLNVTIAPGAQPGPREIRLGAPGGLTNPMCFQVGQLREIREPESLEPLARPGTKGAAREARFGAAFGGQGGTPVPVLEPPVLLNGQVLQGEVDRFPIRARKGQHLVIRVAARSLLPYLADAVPGWFQAVAALSDAGGKEIAYADDYRFDPDPVLYYEIPADGDYQLEIRDSIHRGREDFVYRVSVTEQPFITGIFPLGARAGSTATAALTGWNLTEKRLPLDTQPGPDSVRRAALRADGRSSNEVPYAVDTLPEQMEAEPNDTGKVAQPVTAPVIINGRISSLSDVDVFRIEGRAGQEIVAEVLARRLGSPLNSLLRLIDGAGRVVAWNDDQDDPEYGLITHHADSYLCTKLPKDGPYFVRLSDAETHGDDSYAYRLHIRPRRPDFALRVTPSTVNVVGTGISPITVHALRKDGFDGEVELVLKDAPPGFHLSGARVPRGRDCVCVTLSVPWMRPDRSKEPFALRLEGRAKIGTETVTRPAVPADDLMQAFAYRQLVPRQSLMLVAAGRRASGIQLADTATVRIPAGGAVEVQVKAPLGPMLQSVKLELSDPPKGVTLDGLKTGSGTLSFTLKADAATAKVGYSDNLIVEAFAEARAGPQGNKGPRAGRRFSVGVLPAIPFEIVQLPRQ